MMGCGACMSCTRWGGGSPTLRADGDIGPYRGIPAFMRAHTVRPYAHGAFAP